MTYKKFLLISAVLLFSSLLWSSSVYAQSPEGVVVIYPAVEEQDDSLALSVFFTIVDAAGRPISQASIDSVEIQLLGGNDEPVPASYGDPKSPFYVAVLLDTSGSMQNVMASVREAAQEAIDNASPTAYLGVIPFNELEIQQGDELQLAADFTNNHGLVKNTIVRIEAIPGASTCLYDATYKAIELLAEQVQSPQERRAIILFTDGKDERREGGPCSFYGYENVIDKALPSNAPNTPIHTIGLCGDAQCGNLNRIELRDMARDTFAFSAFGEQSDLRELFQGIMDGLSSQLVAQTNVFARRGQNEAALIVQVDDTKLTTTFHFFSEREYVRPALPVSAEITGVGYDEENDMYSLSLSLTSPESVHQVVVEVWDTKRGIQIGDPQIFESPGAVTRAERNTAGFEPGGEYAFRVKAVDEQGLLIKSEEGETILAEAGIVYEPRRPEVIFAIQTVEVNTAAGELAIALEILDTEQEFNKYEGFIIDTETGQKVHNFGPDLFSDNRIQEALPDLMLAAQGVRSYQVTLFLTTKGEQRLTAVPYEFKIIPPPPPTFFMRIRAALTPVLCGTILIIILSVIAVVIYWSRPAKQKPLPAPFRTTAQDNVGAPSPPPPPVSLLRLRLRVVRTPKAAPEMQKIITNFPFTIGRDKADFNIPDQRISRPHTRITVHDGQFFLTDLKSSNGTFIRGQRLEPQKPVRLDGLTLVQLGGQTQLELEPQ
jgi:hypothetical protein